MAKITVRDAWRAYTILAVFHKVNNRAPGTDELPIPRKALRRLEAQGFLEKSYKERAAGNVVCVWGIPKYKYVARLLWRLLLAWRRLVYYWRRITGRLPKWVSRK